MNFSKEQQAAISHLSGPALVLAGPGSGKTCVIIQRLFSILEKHPNTKIISITFSKATAQEMQQRFDDLTDKRYSNVYFSTMHSLCFSILKKSCDSSHLPKLIDSEKEMIIKEIYYKVNSYDSVFPDMKLLINSISRLKNNQDTFNPNSVQIKNFMKIYMLYEKHKKVNNLIDYDDMIFYAHNILKNNSEEKFYWRKQYDFIQVDEAQDFTKIQFEIVKQLSSVENNVFIVADDDQSIYGFRGAQPSCLFNFTEQNPLCKKYYLGNNYRCAPNIVFLASNIIKNNQTRFEKNFIAIKNQVGKIKILHAKNTCRQAEFICQTIKKEHYNEKVGILYRNNDSVLPLIVAFLHYGVAFKISADRFPISHTYIDYFLRECIRFRQKKDKPLTLFYRIINNGFISNYMSTKGSSSHVADTMETTLNFMHTICYFSDSYKDIFTFVERVKTIFDNKKYATFSFESNIFLSTIHSVKGLEYDSVFLIDLNKDKFPGKSSVTGELLEEERRLYYVAITRAKKTLYLMYTEKNEIKPQEESIFITESRQVLKGG